MVRNISVIGVEKNLTKEDNKKAFLESCNLSKKLRKMEGLPKQKKGKYNVGKIKRVDWWWTK